jgi:hypothetical protein
MDEPKPTKVYKVTLCVVDTDGIGEDDVCSVLENTRYPNHCIAPRIMAIEERTVGWHDRHPLNLAGEDSAEFARLFGPVIQLGDGAAVPEPEPSAGVLRAIADHASGNVTSDAELERLAQVPGGVGWTARAALERRVDMIEERRCAVLNVARDRMAAMRAMLDEVRHAKRHLESDTSGMPIGRAPTPVEARLMKATLDEIRRAPSRPLMFDSDQPTPRADGFDQRRIDEIKASLLTVSTKAVRK